ncbi:MAG: NAD-dependent deacylase [Bacteroidales bacterium]|nr:NAD-dependent deacylase [Bacteroidales bacterium]
MMKIAVFTGAGISRESGIATFRNSSGLWANYRIEDVCTPEALVRNREGVIDFYNMRRREVLSKEPNAAHRALVELERHFEVEVITQNIDDLHERAGSTRVTHLHGEIRKLRSSLSELATVPIEGWEQKYDTRHPDGSLLRPFVVFFGESVPMLERAIEVTRTADLMIVVGTSLQVYPAASLVYYLRPGTPVYLIDPHAPALSLDNLQIIREPASTGVPKVVDELIDKYQL